MELLNFELVETDTYLAVTPAEGPPRLFGGQVAAQALRAAILTVAEDRPVHSFHAYFVRPGLLGVPLRLVVERTRDGRSFSTRRVTALQQDEAIFILEASFHIPEDGFNWQVPARTPAKYPDQVKKHEPVDETLKRMWLGTTMLFEIRPITPTDELTIHPAWVRLNEQIGDDPALHASALTYVSDIAVVYAAAAPGSPPSSDWASLDHSIWFHRPFRLDDWLLFSVEPVINFGARGLAIGSFHTAEGARVASLVQECLLRPPDPSHS